MTTTHLVVLGVVGLVVVLTVLAVRHARTVLDEAELRTGVPHRLLRDNPDPAEQRRQQIRAVDDDEDERTA